MNNKLYIDGKLVTETNAWRVRQPHHLVMAFMSGMSLASGVSARCYVEALEKVMATEHDGVVS